MQKATIGNNRKLTVLIKRNKKYHTSKPQINMRNLVYNGYHIVLSLH